MKKFFAGAIMAAVILFTLIAAAPEVSASEMKVSADAIAVLKVDEGFSRTPYWDYAQWTVGYGTKCPDDKLEYYKQNGITEEEAEALLQLYLTKFEEELYKFMEKTGVTLNQNQFDALVLFSYNCGSAWSYDKYGGLYNAVISGATGNTLIQAFSRWCNAGGQLKTSLLKRRLRDANMYLNGEYSNKVPEHYGYVLFDACGGTASPNVQGYDVNLTAQIIPQAAYEGYTFAGWYTERTGGTKVEILDASVKNTRLYAHWTDAEGKDPNAEEEGTAITVTATDVNLREGPGTGYAVIGKATTGDQLVVTETAKDDSYHWGKTHKGWLCLQYTNYDAVIAPKPESPDNTTAVMGTVKVSSQLRVRSGPSTGYGVVGTLNNGDRVAILEQKTAGAMLWGRINTGWISMSYVVLDQVEELPEETEPPTTEPPVTEPPTTVPPVTEPPATEPPETEPPEQQKWVGTVKVTSTPLRIRSGPSTTTTVVGYLTNGTKVTVTEKVTTDTMVWGKIDKGWISLDYVVFDSTSQDSTATKVIGTVKVDSTLRIRKGPGASYAICGYYYNNDKVTITEQRKVGETIWGKTDKGWISLDYVAISGQSSETPPQTTTKRVTATCLRIRKSADTSAKIVGYLYQGDKVQILETKKVGKTSWGRVSKGWISMDYVK